MLDERVKIIESKIENLEKTFQEHCKIQEDKLAGFENAINERLQSIENFVGGYNTILGLAKKHWKTIMVFGAGVMSAMGTGNPALWAFLTRFAGG